MEHNITLQPSNRKIKFISYLLAILILLWLPREDTNLRAPWLLAITIGGLLALKTLPQTIMGKTSPPELHRLILIGVITGLIIPLMTVFLLIFKSGLHGHGFADFTNQQLFSVLQVTPWSTLIGLTAGLLVGIWRLAATRRG